VLFDVPREADLLCKRLREQRLVWMHVREGMQFVAASLRSEPGDLAALLRSVEAWVAEQGLPRMQFELDGRSYTLRAQPAFLH
jgi:hypothetical protein